MGATKTGKKKEKLPKGAGRVPEWWLEMTPHDTLYLEEDEAQRQAEYEEEMKFAQLAAEQDLLQKWGGEGFPDWNPSTDGPRTKDEETEWTSKGYTKKEATNEWVNDQGTPLEGRQFNGKMPLGYLPGQYVEGGPGGAGAFGSGQGALSLSSKYQQDEGNNWKQPSWMKMKLRSTKEGNMIRKGDEPLEGKAIVKGSNSNKEGGVPPPPKTPDKLVVTDDEVALEEESVVEVFEDHEDDEVEHPSTPTKAFVDLEKKHLEPKQEASLELQKILENRRDHDVNGDSYADLEKTKESAQQATPELQKILERRRKADEAGE